MYVAIRDMFLKVAVVCRWPSAFSATCSLNNPASYDELISSCAAESSTNSKVAVVCRWPGAYSATWSLKNPASYDELISSCAAESSTNSKVVVVCR